MTFGIYDRVKESTTTTGTGDITLGGAETTYQSFAVAVGIGNSTYYCIQNPGAMEWEVGLGTLSSATTLQRATVLSSSNGGSLVNFSPGTKDVFVTAPASQIPLLGSSNTFSGTLTASLVDSGGQVYNIKSYGAKGDGVTDDTTAINNAISAAAVAGGTVLLPPANYLALGVNLKSNVKLSGYGATLIKNGGVSNSILLTLPGTVSSTSSTLTGNVSSGATSVSVSSATGFSVGQYCVLYDLTYKVPSLTAGRNQEIVRIQSILGNTITFYGMTVGSYATASTATLAVLSAVSNSVVEGLTLVNTGSDGGGLVYGTYCYNVVCKDLEVVGPAGWPGIRFDQSQLVIVDKCHIRDGWNMTNVDYGIGVNFNESCIGCVYQNCKMENVQESWVTENVRFSGFVNCTAMNCKNNGFNTHGSGNQGCFIVGCNIFNSGGVGIAVGFTSCVAEDWDILIANNTIINCAANGIEISANTGSSPEQFMRRINVQGNTILGFSESAGFVGISVVQALDSVISGNTISSNQNSGFAAIYFESFLYSRCSDNVIGSTDGNTYALFYNACPFSIIENNTLGHSSTGALRGSNSSGSNVGLMVRHNYCSAPKGNSVAAGDEILIENYYNVVSGTLDNGELVTLPYSSTVTPTPHQGNYQTLTVSDGNPFTIAACALVSKRSFTLVIYNNTSGSLGAITWNSQYVFTNGSWTSPAASKRRSIYFVWNGTNYVEQYRSTQDF